MSTTTASRPALRRIRDGYWRVTAADGHVLGYVESSDRADAERFTAKRLLRSLQVVAIGEFGSADDAVESLR
jgi:hypothetical protein